MRHPAPASSYVARRAWLEEYFDRTAAETWARLTSDEPVGRIRASVRAGRERMRGTLVDWLPRDLRGRRVMDAGCGTGAVAVELGHRGARVDGVDLSATLVRLAEERLPAGLAGLVTFRAGDMLSPVRERYDYVVAMDSLIHYAAADLVATLAGLAALATGAVLFTFAPRTPLLAAMHAVGTLLPRGQRAPRIEPLAEAELRALIAEHAGFHGWRIGRSERIHAGFYTSQAMELVRQRGGDRAQPAPVNAIDTRSDT